jgi:hypothetical protein
MSTLREKQPFELWLSSIIGDRGVFAKTRADYLPRMKPNLAIEEHFTPGGASLLIGMGAIVVFT